MPSSILPTNLEMTVVVLLIDVVTSSSSEETVWTGLPGPWVDRSTFFKLAFILLSVLIWQLASLPVCLFHCPKLAPPCPLPASMLALCASLFPPSGLPVLPRWSLSRLGLNPHAQSRNFSTKRMRISPSQSGMRSDEFFFTMRTCIWPSHGCGLHSYTHAVALPIETESSCGEGCLGDLPVVWQVLTLWFAVRTTL